MDNGQVNGSTVLQAKLNEPTTVAALTRLLDRIESLEQTVNTLADIVQQGPGMAAMVGDMVDETVRQASASGVDVEQRLKTGLEIAEKLTAPGMVEKIEQLFSLVDEAPKMMAMVGDMVDETIHQASANGVDVETRLRAGLSIANRLTEPRMIANLEQLLDMVDQAPGMAAMVGDMVDETVRQASANGIDIEGRARAGLAMAEKLTAPEMMQALDTLVDPNVVSLLNKAGNAIATASAEKPKKLGLFGLLSVMRDPEIQKALGFLTSVGKNLGKEL